MQANTQGDLSEVIFDGRTVQLTACDEHPK